MRRLPFDHKESSTGDGYPNRSKGVYSQQVATVGSTSGTPVEPRGIIACLDHTESDLERGCPGFERSVRAGRTGRTARQGQLEQM